MPGSHWSFTAGCLRCGGELEAVNVGRTTGSQASAILACRPCKAEWQVLVHMLPTNQRSGVGIARAPEVRCGSDSGYRQHRRKGEEACEECKAAHARRVAGWKSERRGRVSA